MFPPGVVFVLPPGVVFVLPPGVVFVFPPGVVFVFPPGVVFVFPPGVVFVFPPGVVPLSSTLIVAVPLTPFDDVAVITTVPSFTPVTFPVLSTVAIVSLALDHVIFVSVIGDVVAVN